MLDSAIYDAPTAPPPKRHHPQRSQHLLCFLLLLLFVACRDHRNMSPTDSSLLRQWFQFLYKKSANDPPEGGPKTPPRPVGGHQEARRVCAAGNDSRLSRRQPLLLPNPARQGERGTAPGLPEWWMRVGHPSRAFPARPVMDIFLDVQCALLTIEVICKEIKIRAPGARFKLGLSHITYEACFRAVMAEYN